MRLNINKMATTPPHRVYKKNFLTNVVFRIDFPTILELKEKVPSQFQASIQSKFPILKEAQEFGFEFVVSETEKESKPLHSKMWQFYDTTKKKITTLSSSFLALEYLSYNNFDEFKENVDFIFGALYETYKIPLITRVGLRYINQIKLDSGNPLNWEGLINPALTSVIDFIASSDMSRAMHEVRIKKEEYELIFRFGIANSMYPNKIVRKEFILDYDCYIKNDFELDINKIQAIVSEYNEAIRQLFEKSIDDELRQMMEEQKSEKVQEIEEGD